MPATFSRTAKVSSACSIHKRSFVALSPVIARVFERPSPAPSTRRQRAGRIRPAASKLQLSGIFAQKTAHPGDTRKPQTKKPRLPVAILGDKLHFRCPKSGALSTSTFQLRGQFPFPIAFYAPSWKRQMIVQFWGCPTHVSFYHCN